MRSEYKISLYGQSESGKTCLLATVAMGAIGHAGGLTAERLPVTVSKPIRSGRLSRAEKKALALHNGKEWIDEAVQRLEAGNTPKGNPPDDLEREVDFKLGSPSRGDIYLRMIDYAGELINPEKESTRGGASEKLKRQLEKSDGFLILVETPMLGDSAEAGEKIKDAVRPLREAFSSLNNRKDMVQIPVAIALTKWDRYCKIDFDNPAGERDKLEQFLANNEQLASLARTIANAMVEQSKDPIADIQPAVGIGNCLVFPVSAFGISERREEGGKKKELPIKGLRRPFNILAPLAWLADRKDQLDAEEIGKKWSKDGPKAWWPSKLLKTNYALGESTLYLARASRLNSDFKKIEKIRNGYRASLLAGMALVFGCTAFIADSSWSLVSRYQFGRMIRVTANSDSNEEELVSAQRWFDSYGSVWRGFFGNSRKLAVVEAEKIQTRLEDLYWNPVVNAKEDNEKFQAATAYKDRFPNGRNKNEAETIVIDRSRRDGFLANDVFLDTLRLEAQSAKSIEDWEKVIERAQKELPANKWATDKQNKDLAGLKAQAFQTMVSLKNDKAFSEFVDQYSTLMQTANYLETFRLISNARIGEKNLNNFVSKFPADIVAKTRIEAKKSIEKKSYSDTYKLIQAGKDALSSMESWCRQKQNNELANGQQEGIRSLETAKADLEKSEDQYLYSIVCAREDGESCKRYLTEAPIKTMKDKVKAFQDYCSDMQKPLNITVEVKIWWGRTYAPWWNKHKVSISCDNVICIKPEKNIASSPASFSESLGRFQVQNKKIDDAIKLEVTVQPMGYLVNGSVSDGSSTLRIKDLVNYDLNLRPRDTCPNDVRFNIIDGLPTKPELPQWKN